MTPLVVAKAPVPGLVKTRLAADVGDIGAAELAAAAVLDTLEVMAATFGPGVVALTGDLDSARRGDEVREALAPWRVVPQHGETLGERLARAHAEVAGPVVQVGMDTPHVTNAELAAAVEPLHVCDGALGPAEDGGWWVLALNDPRHAAALRDVPTSRPDTGSLTLAALSSDIVVAAVGRTFDVDTADDAERSAALAPATRFAEAWRSLQRSEARSAR